MAEVRGLGDGARASTAERLDVGAAEACVPGGGVVRRGEAAVLAVPPQGPAADTEGCLHLHGTHEVLVAAVFMR